MNDIDLRTLETITGGNLPATTTARPNRGASSSSTLQTALTGVTSALDSLKQNQGKHGSLEQLLPIAMMARWIQNR